MNLELPIKSNKTFLLEWWNAFWNLFSDSIKSSFSKANQQNFSEDLLNRVNLGDLFNQSYFENMVNNYSQILKPSTMYNTEFDGISLPQGLPMNNLAIFEIWKNNQDSLQGNQAQNNFNQNHENFYVKQNSSDSNSISSKSNEFNNSNHNIKNSNNNMQKRFESTNMTLNNKELLNKIRRRSIKNNKIVFVHPHKAIKANLLLNNDSCNTPSQIVTCQNNDFNNNHSISSNNNIINNDIIKIDTSNNLKDDNMTIYSFNEKETFSQSTNNKGKFYYYV